MGTGVKNVFFSMLLGGAGVFAQEAFVYEYSGEFDAFAFRSQVVMQVEKAGQMSFETPYEMQILVTCLDPDRSLCPVKFKSNFCIPAIKLDVAPVCNQSGTHYNLIERKELQSKFYAARLLGSLCVSQENIDAPIVPHPQVSFVLRENTSKKAMHEPISIVPKRFEKRFGVSLSDLKEKFVCKDSLEIIQ